MEQSKIIDTTEMYQMTPYDDGSDADNKVIEMATAETNTARNGLGEELHALIDTRGTANTKDTRGGPTEVEAVARGEVR